jgi:hypothetical protein
VDSGGTIEAHSDFTRIERHLNRADLTSFRMPNLVEMGDPVYAQLAEVLTRQPRPATATFRGT